MRAHILTEACWFCRGPVTPTWLTCSRECANAWLGLLYLGAAAGDGGPVFKDEVGQIHQESRSEVRS